MNNILKPIPCEILDIKKESLLEHTFRVKTDIKVNHGQFLQLSIPKIGEAPISVSAYGDGWLDFTIRAVGKVTDEIFSKKVGDTLFLRGAYGNGWPFDEKFKGKNLVVITGGTGLASVRSMLNCCYEEDLCKSVTLIAGFKNDKDKIDGWNVGFVTDFVSKVDYKSFGDDYEVIIVGPPAMMKFTSLAVAKCGVPEDKIWVSFERKMSCAVGKCGHCRIDEVYVCLEGPVFNYTVAKDLVD